MSTPPVPKMHTLDATRWVAAFAVAALHAGYLHGAHQSTYLAVDFFFALSGFVIAHAYDARLAAGMSAKEFIARRVLRLYPLFALGLALGLVAAVTYIAVGEGENTLGTVLVQFASNLLFLPYLSSDPEALVAPLNGPYWSLILEIHINVAFALAFAWLSFRVLGGLVAVFALALVAIAGATGTLETGFLISDYFAGVARVGFSFTLGILLSRLRHRIKVPRLHWGVVLGVTALILVLPRPTEVMAIYDLVCVVVLFPLLILCGARSPATSPWTIRLFGIAGGASYALYAIHTPVLQLGQLFADAAPDLPYKVMILPFLLLACAAAVAADLLYDRPLRRWVSARLASRRVTTKPRSKHTLPVD